MTIDTVAALLERHGLAALAFPRQGVVYGMDGDRTIVDLALYTTAGVYWSCTEAHGGTSRSRCEILCGDADGESNLSAWLVALGYPSHELEAAHDSAPVELLDADLGEWLETQPEAPSTAVIPLRTPKHLSTLEARRAAIRERFDRAAGELTVERIAPGVYHVTGGTDPAGHYVNFVDRTVPTCACGDRVWRRLPCKHILAAKLHEAGGVEDSVIGWAESQVAA